MQWLKTLRTAALAALVAGGALFSTGSGATVLVLGSGWQYDQLDAIGAPTEGTPWTFTVTDRAIFSITDAFIPGDHYTVSGSFSLGTAFGLLPVVWSAPSGDGIADAAWPDISFQHGQIILGPGSYSIDITGDGAGGIPAGLYVRLDAPEPATLALLGLGLFGLAFSRRRTLN